MVPEAPVQPVIHDSYELGVAELVIPVGVEYSVEHVHQVRVELEAGGAVDGANELGTGDGNVGDGVKADGLGELLQVVQKHGELLELGQSDAFASALPLVGPLDVGGLVVVVQSGVAQHKPGEVHRRDGGLAAGELLELDFYQLSLEVVVEAGRCSEV